MPIDEAKKLIVQHGLPVRASGAVEDAAIGTHAPAYGEASGGRDDSRCRKAPGGGTATGRRQADSGCEEVKRNRRNERP